MEIRRDYYPEDIALALMAVAEGENLQNFDEHGELNQKIDDCTEAIYYLMAICENPYNKDHFRTLWETLQNIAERFEGGEI